MVYLSNNEPAITKFMNNNKRIDFELFKSNVCHKLKFMGDIEFIRTYLTNGHIREYFNKKWYPECFYLLGMVDYISRINDISYCSEFDDLRHYKLSEMLYPRDVILDSIIREGCDIKSNVLDQAIPEFLWYNIIECEVRDVI